MTRARLAWWWRYWHARHLEWAARLELEEKPSEAAARYALERAKAHRYRLEMARP